MIKKKISDNYTDNDLIAFEKLENFNNYKITLNDEKNKITPTKYSISDNVYFKNLINNSSNSNKNILANKKKENTNTDYYTERDDSNFERIKQFPPQTSDEFIKKKNDNYVISNNYKVSDVSAFEQIIKSNNIQKNTSTSVDNRNIKIIDSDKLDKDKKKLGIEKIKVIYFD